MMDLTKPYLTGSETPEEFEQRVRDSIESGLLSVWHVADCALLASHHGDESVYGHILDHYLTNTNRYSSGSLANLLTVARRWPPAKRLVPVDFSYYQEVTAIGDDEVAWDILQGALEGNLSCAEVRRSVDKVLDRNPPVKQVTTGRLHINGSRMHIELDLDQTLEDGFVDGMEIKVALTQLTSKNKPRKKRHEQRETSSSSERTVVSPDPAV